MGANFRVGPFRAALILAALALWLTAIAFLRKLSIDESQYVASAVLTSKGLLPYRDYAYLQTPLQPFALAPLQWLFAGHVLIAMRVANAVSGPAAEQALSPTNRLAAMLKEALAANTIGGKADDDSRARAAAEDVRQAQAAWAKLGPVSEAARRQLSDRFHRAIRKVTERVPPAAQRGVSSVSNRSRK